MVVDDQECCIPLNTGALNVLNELKQSDQILRIYETCKMLTEVAVSPLKIGGMATNADDPLDKVGPEISKPGLKVENPPPTPRGSTRAQIDRQPCRESAPLCSRTRSDSPAVRAELDNSEKYTKVGPT
jgi:hypothetical protein